MSMTTMTEKGGKRDKKKKKKRTRVSCSLYLGSALITFTVDQLPVPIYESLLPLINYVIISITL